MVREVEIPQCPHSGVGLSAPPYHIGTPQCLKNTQEENQILTRSRMVSKIASFARLQVKPAPDLRSCKMRDLSQFHLTRMGTTYLGIRAMFVSNPYLPDASLALLAGASFGHSQ